MKKSQPNANQKRFMENMGEWARENNGLGLLYGKEYDDSHDFQIHHVLGRTAKHNKVPIGHEFIIPVPTELHDPNYSHKLHVHKCKKEFVKKFGNQRGIFEKICYEMRLCDYPTPDQHIYEAIRSTSL